MEIHVERLFTHFSHVKSLSFGFRARSYFHMAVPLLPMIAITTYNLVRPIPTICDKLAYIAFCS